MRDEQLLAGLGSQELVRVDREVLRPPPSVALSEQREAPVSPFVRLTANLFFRDDAPRVLAFVSCKSREGVSSVSHSYQEFLAKIGARVILLQAAQCMTRPTRESISAGSLRLGLAPSQAFLSAREDSDVLLVDCSSLETSPAVFMLASHVDGVLLVVEDGKHSAAAIRGAAKLIKNANGVVLGVILNKRRELFPPWIRSLYSRMTR